MRPRYHVLTLHPPEDVIARIRAELEEPGGTVRAAFAGHHLELMLDDSIRHYWSPRMSLEVESTEGGSVVRTLLGPHPSVWTMFAFVYVTLVFAAFTCFLFGVSQWMASEDAWGLLGLPLIACVVLGMYAISQAGQRLAKDQIHQLQDFLFRALA